MSDNRQFDDRPDPVLGPALREALEPDEDALPSRAFVARVVARFDALGSRAPMWDVLTTWARQGIAAAAALLLIAFTGDAVRSHVEPFAPLDDALAGPEAGIATALLAGENPPDETVLFQDATGSW